MPAPIGGGPPRPAQTTTTTQQPITNTQDDSALPGWMPNRTRQRTQTTDAAGAPLTTDTITQAALDRYKLRFESILGQDAMSLARGRIPFGPGDTLSDVQQRDLLRATEDLLKDVPLGKFSPDLRDRLEVALRERGIDRTLDTTRLGDLGKVGGDLAKSFVDQLRHESPATFYGLATGAAAAIGYAAWDQGSDGLRRLGLKPEIKTDIFNTPSARMRVGVGVDWDPHFTNLQGRASADLTFPGSAMGRPDFRLAADARFNHNGALDTMTTTASVIGSNYTAAAQATMRGNQLEVIAASATYTPTPNLALSAGAMWYQPDKRLTVGAEAAWRLSRDVDLAVSASHDNQGESRIGIGARIRF